MARQPTAIDLFSGAGGLTLGLKQAGYRVVAAVEVSPVIVETYRVNHPDVPMLVRDVRGVTGRDLLRAARVQKVDLLAGCPPCQGFTSLTSKYRGGDARNTLLLEMARLVGELRPRAVLMENVAGLADRGSHLLRAFVERLAGFGYLTNYSVLQLADFGIPQRRRRLVLTAGHGFVIPLPTPTHACRAIPGTGLKQWRTVRDTIASMSEPVTLRQAMTSGGPQRYRWHVVRDVQPATAARLRAVRAGQSRTILPDELRPACHRGRRAGFTNVYGRMSWDRPSPAITGGCTTFCKGRFGHPSLARTISVREAALLQGFPRNYKFSTTRMDLVCDMIGNAFPPPFAGQLGIVLRRVSPPEGDECRRT
jgi:DNA (cytosine-5)-methyltransferase 1